MDDKKKRYTSQEIADILGISRGTVYRALNNKGRIKQETKEKVLKLAGELNYKPNKQARALVLNRKVRLAVIIPAYPEYFFRQIEAGMAKSAEQIKDAWGYDVELLCYRTGFANDGLKQIEILDGVISRNKKEGRYDGLLIVPGSANILKPGLDAASEAGLPVVLINSDVASPRLCYIGENSLSAGRCAGELIVKFTAEAGSVAVMEGYSNAAHLIDRVKGFSQVLESAPSLNLLSPISYFEDAVKAYNITERLIRDYRDLKGVFVTTQTGLAAAGRAVYDNGKAGKINVIGFEYSPEIEELLQKNAVSACISSDPKTQGGCAVKVIAKHITENEAPQADKLYTRLNIMLKETDNAVEYSAYDY